VGVCVGGTGVADGASVCEGGMDVGILVMVRGAPVVLQAASARMIKLSKMGKDNFLIIFPPVTIPCRL